MEWAHEHLIYSNTVMQQYDGDKIDVIKTKWAHEYLMYSGKQCSNTVVIRLMQLA